MRIWGCRPWGGSGTESRLLGTDLANMVSGLKEKLELDDSLQTVYLNVKDALEMVKKSSFFNLLEKYVRTYPLNIRPL
jgi:hypothetical protein